MVQETQVEAYDLHRAWRNLSRAMLAVALLTAPAGFGKSSLAAAWAEKLEQSGNCVGWLTIDPDDDEATRFLFYVSQALHHACPDVGAGAIGLILENNLIDPTAILSSLINDLAEIEDDIYLFLEFSEARTVSLSCGAYNARRTCPAACDPASPESADRD